MLPNSAFDEEIKAFIENHKVSDLESLLLKRPGNKDWDWLWIGQQIEGYQKAIKKVPSIANTKDILFPIRLSLEQCSSDMTADYKSKLFQGSTFLDLSGGFGIDTFHFSKRFKKCYYVEQDKALCDLMLHNSQTLGLKERIILSNEKAERYLENAEKEFDLIYLDPARRDDKGKKVYRFSDCSPDVISMLSLLRKKSKQILIKAAPMLDISQAIRELHYVEKVYVLASSRECKELLFVLGDKENDNPEIISVQMDSKKEFSFYQEDETQLQNPLSMEGKYLYNPGPSISKSGGYKSLAKKFDLKAIHPNTHLFLSNEINENFPGRIFQIKNIIPYGPKYDFGKFGYTIFLKNFPIEKKAILKRYKLKEGNDFALFAFSSTEGKSVMASCVFV